MSPPLFKGATHRIAATGEPVKVTHWKKDGDHPQVERYPVERRAFKGILRVAPRENHALYFGDYIIEDAKGRITVARGVKRKAEELVEEQPGLFRKVERELPSEFEEKYAPLSAQESAAAKALAVLLAVLAALLAPADSLPLVFIGVTHLMYYTTLLAQWNGSANIHDLDEAADDMQVSAHTNTYTVNQDTHDFFDDVTNEVTGTNYTAGGANIDSQTVTRSTGTVTFDGADVVWLQSGAGFSNARKFVVYRNSGSAATSRLFSVVTADADVGNVTGDLTIAWHTNGIAQWSTT